MIKITPTKKKEKKNPQKTEPQKGGKKIKENT